MQARPRTKGAQRARSRFEAFEAKEKDGGVAPLLQLPPIDTGGHLVDHLLKVGPGSDGKPITFVEIKAWCELTGVVLTSWEASTLHGLSVSYMAEYGQADEPDRPPPFTSAISTPVDRAAVSQGVSDLFARLEAQDSEND